MPNRFAAGCQCCGEASCNCCVTQTLKESPSRTGSAGSYTYTDTAWSGWTGVTDTTGNTLAAGDHAYIDVTLDCQDFDAVIEVLDFGTTYDAKIWIDEMEVQMYCASDDANGVAAAMITRTNWAKYESSYSSTSAPGNARYVYLALSSVASAGAQGSSIRAYDDRSGTLNALAISRGATRSAGSRTVRINILAGTSDLEIGLVQIKAGNVTCLSGLGYCSSNCSLGNNDSYYVVEGRTVTVSGGASHTATETSDGLTTIGASGCNETPPSPCQWTNEAVIDYSVVNGTWDYVLQKASNYCTTPSWADASAGEQTAVTDWISRVKSDTWNDSNRPIRFWEYRWASPPVTTRTGSTEWDADTVSWTLEDVCDLTVATESINEPCQGASPVAYPDNTVPKMAEVVRDTDLSLLCDWGVEYCSAGSTIRPSIGFSASCETGRKTVNLVIPYTTFAAIGNDTASAYDITRQESDYVGSCNQTYPWSVRTQWPAISITRSSSTTTYEIPVYSQGGTLGGPTARPLQVTNFVWTVVSTSATSTQNGDAYIPTMTFNATGTPSGCQPDDVWQNAFAFPRYERHINEPFGDDGGTDEGILNGTVNVRVPTEDGTFDVLWVNSGGTDYIYARRNSDCALLFGTVPSSADDCEVLSISLDDGGTNTATFNFLRS